MDGMSTLLEALPPRLRATRWAALFPVVMLVSTLYWGVRPWTLAGVAAAFALTLLVPPLAAAFLIFMAAWWPRDQGRTGRA